MICVFLMHSADIAQAIRDDFMADQVYFYRYGICASSINQVLNLVRHFQAPYFFSTMVSWAQSLKVLAIGVCLLLVRIGNLT